MFTTTCRRAGSKYNVKLKQGKEKERRRKKGEMQEKK